MNEICSRAMCTGCGLCSNICPQNAIVMIEDLVTGHFIPDISQANCINCKLCVQKCPALKKPERYKEIKTYAAWRKDLKKLGKSSSGGVAAVFYEYALQNDYIVTGVFLEKVSIAKMIATTDFNIAKQFQGSKYIQAACGTVYTDCMEALKQNKQVLFIGTPCQCAAAKSMAGKNHKEQLLTVELICHGTPSQRSFRDYLKWIERKTNSHVDDASFRSDYGVELKLKGDNKIIWDRYGTEDDYLVAFQEGLLHNQICFSCPYAEEDRCADITIGDFWKIGIQSPFDKPKCNVSVIITNTEKGNSFINNCSADLHLVKREYQEALYGNPNLWRSSIKNSQYDLFWNEYNRHGIKHAFYKTIHYKVEKHHKIESLKRNLKGIIKKFLNYNV